MPMRWEVPTEAAYRLAQSPPLTHRVSESRNPRIDHYSAAAMYLRLNGLLPPTAKKQAKIVDQKDAAHGGEF